MYHIDKINLLFRNSYVIIKINIIQWKLRVVSSRESGKVSCSGGSKTVLLDGDDGYRGTGP